MGESTSPRHSAWWYLTASLVCLSPTSFQMNINDCFRCESQGKQQSMVPKTLADTQKKKKKKEEQTSLEEKQEWGILAGKKNGSKKGKDDSSCFYVHFWLMCKLQESWSTKEEESKPFRIK